jgi:threonine/homoserine/homoserine lactone efflux protein
MTLYGFAAFCAVYVLAVASPGPGIAAVLARTLACGTRGAHAFIAGFTVGDLIWFVIAATGLAAIAQTAQTAFIVIRYPGAVYLLYLAWRLWTAPARPVEADGAVPAEKPLQIFLGSLALALGNPKTIVFFLALLPTVVDLTTLSLTGYLEIAVAIVVLQPIVIGCYVLAGARARRLFRSSRAVRMLNRGTGAAMAGAAAAVAAQ